MGDIDFIDEKKADELRDKAFAGADHGFPRKPGDPPAAAVGTPAGDEFTLRAQCALGDWFSPYQMRDALAKLDAARELILLMEYDYDKTMECWKAINEAENLRTTRLDNECRAWRAVDSLTKIFQPNETCDCLIAARRLRRQNEEPL